MSDPNKKSTRTFQCRDVLWETFEQMARELECSIDYLINEAMKQYARQRSYGTRTPFPGRPDAAAPSSGPAMGAPAPAAPAIAPPPGPPAGAHPPMPPAAHTSGAGAPAVPLPPAKRASLPPPPPPRGGRPPPVPAQAPAAHSSAPPMAQQQSPAAARFPPPPPPKRPGAGPPPFPRSGPPALPQQPPAMAPPGPPPFPQQQAAPAQAFRQQPAAPAAGPSAYGSQLTIWYMNQSHVVTKDRFIIGRGKQSSDLTIKDPNVSRQHAMVEFLNGQFYMVDMGSTNGIEYNGQRIARKAVAEGDVFRICDHELRFTYR